MDKAVFSLYYWHVSIVDSIGITKKITRPRQEAFIRKYASDGETLDLGCGNDIYKSYFPNCETLDIEARPNVAVDIIGDAHDLSMIGDNSYDTVLCAEVLEHLHTPSAAIAELYRILKPGGVLVLTTRFIFPLHDTPNDFYRYTKYGLTHLMKDFEMVELVEEASTIETLAVLYQRIGFQCDTLRLRPFKIFWFLLAKLTMLFSGVLQRSMEILVTRMWSTIF